jgi:hypothetical protein
MRRAINGVSDAYIFGMLKDECRFLRSRPRHLPITMEHQYGQRAAST